jgi:tetratricopeptide (TPR) repeat protein
MYNSAYQLGTEIRKLLIGDPEEKKRKQEEEARDAEQALQEAKAREAVRQAEEARKRQDTYNRISSELQLSESFDGDKNGLTLKLGDSDDGLHPQGTSFFGSGGGSSPPPLIMGNPETATSPDKQKKASCEWGTTDASVVDLRCLGLDPNKPIAVDPHIAKGKERVFPAQPDPKTFENVNYNKGFEALMRFDVASAAAAVTYFNQAKKERPNDPLVRNALLLAQDILKARQQKETSNRAQAFFFTQLSYAALMMGDNEKAKGYIAQARKLDPDDNTTKYVESLANLDLRPDDTYPPGRKDAYRLFANSMLSISKKDLPAAISMMEAAQRLQPRDPHISAFLLAMRNYEAGQATLNTRK